MYTDVEEDARLWVSSSCFVEGSVLRQQQAMYVWILLVELIWLLHDTPGKSIATDCLLEEKRGLGV